MSSTGRYGDRVDGESHRVAADLRSPEEAGRVIDAAIEAWTMLDGVVMALGVVAFGPVVELDTDVLEELFLTNLFAPVFVSRAALRHLGPSAFIANISAVVAETPAPGMAANAASKAALTAFDRGDQSSLWARSGTGAP